MLIVSLLIENQCVNNKMKILFLYFLKKMKNVLVKFEFEAICVKLFLSKISKSVMLIIVNIADKRH